MATATAYGPSGSTTWRVPWSSVVYAQWGAPTARPYHGLAPSTWAAQTARLHANAERALADEAGGPVAQLLPVPQDGGDGDEDSDPLAALKADIAAAKGRALLVETTAAAWGDGRAAAPVTDWKQQRMGAHPPEALVNAWLMRRSCACWRPLACRLASLSMPMGLRNAKHSGVGTWGSYGRWRRRFGV